MVVRSVGNGSVLGHSVVFLSLSLSLLALCLSVRKNPPSLESRSSWEENNVRVNALPTLQCRALRLAERPESMSRGPIRLVILWFKNARVCMCVRLRAFLCADVQTLLSWWYWLAIYSHLLFDFFLTWQYLFGFIPSHSDSMIQSAAMRQFTQNTFCIHLCFCFKCFV